MSLRTAIHACLQADERVTALLGSEGALRHYPERAPQGMMQSHVVSSEIAGDPHASHGTPDDAEDTLDETLVQFTCLAASVDEALAIRAAVRAALMDDAAGVLAAAHIVVTSPQTRFDTPDEVDLHGAQLDLTFFHNPNT